MSDEKIFIGDRDSEIYSQLCGILHSFAPEPPRQRTSKVWNWSEPDKRLFGKSENVKAFKKNKHKKKMQRKKKRGY